MKASEQDIAIIGMACLFPKAPDLARYWANILGKVDGIGQPVASWGAERYYNPDMTAGEGSYTTAGGFLGDLYQFNPAEFGIMPNSLDGSEPDQFLALRMARAALIDAGYADAEVDHTRTGIILGHSTYLHRGNATVVQHGVVLDQTVALFRQCFPDLPEPALARLRALLKSRLPPFNADTAPGLVPNVMTGRIANRLDLKGPNYLIDAACASSLLAVHAAMNELRAGRSDLMLAGGVNASIPAEVFMVFAQLGALSRNSCIRPFDSAANGTLLGEGLGVVVLKRLDDACRDRDRVYAILKVVGQASDGRALGLLAPRLEGEVLAIQRAYEETGIDPRSVSLIEAHGTGIPLGDKTEIAALTQVMGERSGELPGCALGSVKSMISHTIPAAGIAGLIKAALALHHKVLPPTLCDTVNPALEIEKTPFYINNAAGPWIHRQDRPRRAAVNAFGFGGINTHALLEEAPETVAEPADLTPWSGELLALAADSRNALLERIDDALSLLRSIQTPGQEPDTLRDVAYTLALAAEGGGPERLALVAAAPDEAVAKLERARTLLQDAARHTIQSRSGVYFTDQPLAGKLAFVFPGEGAQYPEMLAELAMLFPAVRKCFDSWDAIYAAQRDFQPSQIVFRPPTGVDAAVSQRLDEQLHGLEIGTESVFFATQAVFELLQELGLQPDAMVGHSSGESSAMVAAGVVQLADRDALQQHILRLNDLYHEIDRAGAIASGRLLTVGAVEREAILNLVERSQGQIHLALDNCRHQAVLFGAADALALAAEELRGLGGLCTYLAIDRAYHTPLFAPMAEAIERVSEAIPVGPGRVPLYSCATAGLFPDEPDAIRRLTASQWAARVRFVETIEAMYADGVRIFVEVGPASNLTGFVQDILRDRPHLAVASNHRNRPDLQSLLNLLARLFVQGRLFDLRHLYERRGAQRMAREAPGPARGRLALLTNTLPYIGLTNGDASELRSLLRPPAAAPVLEPAPALPAASGVETHGSDATAEIVQEHFLLMQEFLSQQERIMTAGLGLAAEEAGWPFISRLIEIDATAAVAEFDLRVADQRFLQDHILYAAHVSDLDPNLHGLAVVPLAVSLEMLAEITAVISGKPHLYALENIRAYNWIALDSGEKTLTLTARRLTAAADGERVHAALHEGRGLLIEGEVLFADAPPEAQPLVTPLRNPQPPVWRDEQLYTTGMFHGPLFQSVRHLLAWDDTGMDVELNDTLTQSFFGAGARPAFLLNPVLLDAVGHLTAFWIAQSMGTDFSSFPSQIGRIEVPAGAAEATGGAVLRGRLSFLDRERLGGFLEGDYDCLDGRGAALFRISGWRDRFFGVPHRFYYARFNPRDGWYGEDWGSTLPDLPADTVLWAVPPFPAGFLDDAGAIWKRVLAHTVLSAEERTSWFRLPPQSPEATEWLLGQIALKEAVRCWYWRRTGTLLLPADILIETGPTGRLQVAAALAALLGTVPQVALAHTEGFTVAVAAPPESAVGVEIEPMGRIDAVPAVLTAAEYQQLERTPAVLRKEMALRLWCAKEAAARRVGAGLNDHPYIFEVSYISPEGGKVVVNHNGLNIPVDIYLQGNNLIALAVG